MTAKPRILLIPNVSWWIIGEMARQAAARFRDEYDFYIVPEGIFERRPDLLRTIIPAVDAIHCMNESSIELFRELSPERLPPVATWIHHVTEWSPQHQLAIERSAAITVCTETWKRFLEARTGGGPPVTVVPHGVDLNFFRRRALASGAFGVPEGKFVVGFIGSKGSDHDGGRKGTDTLFAVLEKAAAQIQNLHLLLCGPGWDVELAGLKKLGIDATATGYIPQGDLPALYSALDAYLLTSRVEGGPCTVFEAMACETPVVSTRVGAVPDLIVDGFNGYSAEVDDADTLCSALGALAASPELRSRIAANAHKTISKLPWGVALAPLGPLYERLVEASRRTQSGPSWMLHPERVQRAAAAADALSTVIVRLQHKKTTPRHALRSLYEMLGRRSILDAARGLAMLRGLSYKALQGSDQESGPAMHAGKGTI